jgi:SAM-dependent methyltransferase
VSSVTRGFGLLEHLLAVKRAEMADRLIPDNLRAFRILDIGCGSYPIFLAKTKFNEKYGLDKSINSSIDDLILKRFDITSKPNLPFKRDFFAVVTLLAVFEHLDPKILVSFLKECRRVLKNGGRLIITTPAPWTGILLGIMAKLCLVSREEIKEHIRLYSHKEIISYLEKSGFESIDFGYFEFMLNSWSCAIK